MLDELPLSIRGSGCRRKPRHTTHHQHLLESVTVIRARHPFEGRLLNVLGTTHRKGRLHLVLILPDGSKSLIPADWTDLASAKQSKRPFSAQTAATLGSLEDLLHARAVVDALLSRLAVPTSETRNTPARKESHIAREKSDPVRSSPQRDPPWETLHDEHKILATDILARLLANTAPRNHDEEKNHD
jgi:hypothetical protein